MLTLSIAIAKLQIADGDTGYGNAINVKRTVKGFANAGAAGIMLEDQLQPKRCGHTKGKSVVSREEAELRIQAAVDAREEVCLLLCSSYKRIYLFSRWDVTL